MKGKMKKKSIAGLIVIAVIVAVVMFSGCIGSKTPIHDIHENPDKYVDKEVTIKATVKGLILLPTLSGSSNYHNRPDCSGFWINDIGKSKDMIGLERGHDDIFVAYDGNIPREQREEFKDKWGQIRSRTVKVKGVVRHELQELPFGVCRPCFYIEGESWEFID